MIGHNGAPQSGTLRSGMKPAKRHPCPDPRPPGPVCDPQPYRSATPTGWAAACRICGRGTACPPPPATEETDR